MEESQLTVGAGHVVDTVVYIIGGIIAILSWAVKGVVAEIERIKHKAERHEVESATKIATLTAIAEESSRGLVRIHERVDDLVNLTNKLIQRRD